MQGTDTNKTQGDVRPGKNLDSRAMQGTDTNKTRGDVRPGKNRDS